MAAECASQLGHASRLEELRGSAGRGDAGGERELADGLLPPLPPLVRRGEPLINGRAMMDTMPPAAAPGSESTLWAAPIVEAAR